ERIPVFAVFSVVIGDDVIEQVGELELTIGASAPAFDVLEIPQREDPLLTGRAAKELAAHQIGHQIGEQHASLSLDCFDLRSAERSEEDAEARNALEGLVGHQHTTDEWVALEEGVAMAQQRARLGEVERLEIAADVHHDVPAALAAQRLDVRAGAEVILDTVLLAGPRIARVAQDDGLETLRVVWVAARQRANERALPDARGSAQDH